MDAMVKAVQSGIAPGNSRVIWDRVGFTPEEQRLLEVEVAKQEALQRATVLSSASQSVGQHSKDAAIGSGIASGNIGIDAFVSGSDSSGL